MQGFRILQDLVAKGISWIVAIESSSHLDVVVSFGQYTTFTPRVMKFFGAFKECLALDRHWRPDIEKVMIRGAVGEHNSIN